MTNTDITKTELEEISDESFTQNKINLSSMIKKRENTNNTSSPPKEKEVIEEKIEDTPKIKLSLKKDVPKTSEEKEVIEEKIEDTPKIKLSLKKDVPKTSEEKEIIEEKIEDTPKIKLSLKKEVPKTSEEKEVIEEKIEKKSTPIKKEVPKETEPIIKSDEIILTSVKKEIKQVENNNNNEKKESEEIKLGEKILITDNNSIFNNYESDFNKEGNYILERLKKLKSMPKTRVGLIIGLIALTVIIVISVFTLDPKHQNIENYKTSILGIKKVDKNKSIENKNITKKKNSINKNIEIKKDPPIIWKLKTINKNGNNISIQYKALKNGTEIYKYKNKEYNSLEELEKFIEKNSSTKKENHKKINNKIQNFLLRK